ncbi:hypothetical protein P8C59_007193 [Phyllachora maydis]|uniref:DNA repair protein REV1 n=1 Tax=Phyllachora maydis TaxID=1825666 RepID=A0AAD9I910_9PEZI|nr:hypothetical protein P8C59_007193 [Phyllachora maydis]
MGSRLEKGSASVRKRIEAHDFTDEAGEEYEGSAFGGFNDYFRRKKIKLQNRDAELRAASLGPDGSAPPPPQIFRGVVAHVSGYTQPPLHVLHRDLVRHGAGFLQYLDSKTMATHIIASAMPPKKSVDFHRYRVVKPAWVTDSIQAGRLLPWSDYRLLDEGPRQKTLGLDGHGNVFSQAFQKSPAGYQEQIGTSFYTSQLQRSAGQTSSAQAEAAAAMDGPSKQTAMTSEEHNAKLLEDPRLRKSSTANPDFLKQYYSESRLHHLSTWRAELKAKMQKLAADKGARARNVRRKPGSRRYIMHVDFDSFFCAVSLLKHARPECAARPAVVAHSAGDGSEIASCNYPARAFGVRNGMWMKRALELCPELKVLPASV